MYVRQMLSTFESNQSRCFCRDEPLHIHVEREAKIAKFWLNPLMLQRSGGFNRMELSQIQKIIEEHHAHIMEAWHDYFGR